MRGSAYIEYFVVAAAFAAAALWLFDGGNFHGLRGTVDARFNAQMVDLAGPVM